MRSQARRARARWGDLGALLAARGLRAEDIRWIARTARGRGEAAVARDALLVLVFMSKATKEEERLVRELTDPTPDRPGTPSDEPPVWPASRAAGGPRMVLSRDDRHGHPVARLVHAGAPATDEPKVLSPCRPGWERLPRSLADQLSVCVLTRVARANGVVEIAAAEPSTEPVAAAISGAVRRSSVRHAEVAR